MTTLTSIVQRIVEHRAHVTALGQALVGLAIAIAGAVAGDTVVTVVGCTVLLGGRIDWAAAELHRHLDEKTSEIHFNYDQGEQLGLTLSSTGPLFDDGFTVSGALGERRCIVCGCTETQPCDPPCAWVPASVSGPWVDLCNNPECVALYGEGAGPTRDAGSVR